MDIDLIDSQDVGIEHGVNIPRSRGRRRQNNRIASTIDLDVPSKPIILKVNPYVDSSQKALDLMAKICSAEPSDKAIELVTEITRILDGLSFSDLVNKNRSLLYNPTFDKDILSLFDKMVFAMENEALGNRSRVRIVVAALFSAGKSSLLNHIVQQSDLLPTDTNPSTVVPAYLYCRKDIAEKYIYGVNKNRAMVQLDGFALSGIEHDCKKGDGGAIQKGVSEQISTALHHFIVEIPHKEFDDVVFIDTPGFGNSGSHDSRTAYESLDSADILVYLSDCSNGHIKKEEFPILERFTKDNKRPVIIVITKNDLPPRESAESTFEHIKSQVESYPSVKDVLCVSVNEKAKNFWSRSGLSLVDSLKSVSQNIKVRTDIDKYWTAIDCAFEKEIKHLTNLIAKLRKDKRDVLNALLELDKKELNLDSDEIVSLKQKATSNNRVLSQLVDYYQFYFEEEKNRHRRIISVFSNKIKESSNLKSSLKDIRERLLWWKIDTVKQLIPMEYKKAHIRKTCTPFDAIKDVTDTSLSKFIDSIGNGYDITTTYNDDGFSLLTYTAYCGNMQALLFILNKVSERFVFMRDKNKRNIMHAAAEGLQYNILKYLKAKYPGYILQKDSQGRTCDEIYFQSLKSKQI